MIQVTINQADLKKLLNKLDTDIRGQVIMDSLYLSAQYLTGWIQTNRLTGPRPQYLGVVTGRLRSSITASPTIKSGDTYTAKIGTNVVYARIHEYGGQTGRKHATTIPARPYMRPAIEDSDNQQGVVNDLVRNITKQLES
jgi:phage gpG-like protein